MLQLYFSSGFKKVLPSLEFQIEASTLADVYTELWKCQTKLNSILFLGDSKRPKSFLCLLCNHKQINHQNLDFLFQDNDRLDIILPLSGG